MDYQVHETAIVDEGATIGAGTKVWHWVHVSGGARIGSGCSLGQGVFIGNQVVLGNNVKIQNCVLVCDNVTLEDDVFVGPTVAFTNVYNPRSAIVRKDEYRDTVVEQGASLGANCTLVCGVRVGKFAFVGANALIRKDVPAFALMVGVPAKQIGWISRFGERLDLPVTGSGETTCPNTGERYRVEDGVCRIVS